MSSRKFRCPTARAGALAASGVLLIVGAAALMSPVRLAAQDVLGSATLFDTATVKSLQHQYAPDLSPAVVAFDAKTKRATITITSHSDSTMPVDLALEFYRIRTDTAGNVTATGSSLAPNDAPSLIDWIHGLPAHVTLAPHATQTITLTADVPDSVASNEYWARLVATAPSMLRQIHAIVQQVSASPTGGMPVLQQQPVNANITFTMANSVKLVYRHVPPTATLSLGPVTTTVLPSGQVRACVPMHRTGTAAVYGTLRISTLTPAKKDTLGVSYPIEVQDDITPCFNVNLLGSVAGTYTIGVSVTPGQNKLPASVGPSFAAASVSASVDLKAPFGRVPGAATASTSAASGVQAIELAVDGGSVQDQLKHQAALAAKDGKRLLIEIGASWCGPCQAFVHSLGDSVMVDALKDVRVVRVDFNQWGQAFVNGVYPTPSALPAFFLINADGTEGTQFDTNAWQTLANQYGTLDARVMGPPLKEFIAKNKSTVK